MKKLYIENKYVFSTYFSILYQSVISRISINAITIFNNQPCVNHKDMKIICKQCITVSGSNKLLVFIYKSLTVYNKYCLPLYIGI